MLPPRSLPIAALLLAACTPAPPPSAPPAPTADEARAFIERADAGFREHVVAESRAAWAYATNITPETEAAAATAEEATMAFISATVREAARFGRRGQDGDRPRLGANTIQHIQNTTRRDEVGVAAVDEPVLELVQQTQQSCAATRYRRPGYPPGVGGSFDSRTCDPRSRMR